MAVSVESFYNKFMQGEALEESIWISFPGQLVEFRTNNSELADIISKYYAPFLNESAPSTDKTGQNNMTTVVVDAIEMPTVNLDVSFELLKRAPGKKPKEEICDVEDGRFIRKVRTGMIFGIAGQCNIAVGECVKNEAQIINFINNRFQCFRMRENDLLLHASGVCSSDKGMALTGFSGAGKSTLALHVLKPGIDFVSNDRLMVRQDNGRLVMQGLAKQPRVNPGTIVHHPKLKEMFPPDKREKYLSMHPSALWEHEEKYDASIEKWFSPSKHILQSAITSLVVLHWTHDTGDCLIKDVNIEQRTDLLPAIEKSAGPFCITEDGKQIPTQSESMYTSVLKKINVYEITGSIDFEKAGEFCRSIL